MSSPSMLDRRLEAADPLRGRDTTADADALRAPVLAAARVSAPSEPRTRRLAPALALAASLAIAAVGAIALMPSSQPGSTTHASLPGPVAAFAATVRDASLLHVVTTSTGTLDSTGRFTPSPDPERADGWYAMDGSASRTSYVDDSGKVLAESVRKGREVWVFNSRDGLLQRYESKHAGDAGSWLLALRQGIRGQGLMVVGRTQVRGRAAYEIAYDQYHGDAYPDDHRAFVAVDDGALLRIDALSVPLPANAAPDTPRWERTEVLTFEAKPPDPQLLEPSHQFRDLSDDAPAGGPPATPATP